MTVQRPKVHNQNESIGNLMIPTNMQKRILVHFKYYPNIESIPERVEWPKMNKAMSQYRIKVSFTMIVVTLFLCFCTAWYGKTHMYETSLVQVNLDRHLAYKKGEDFMGRRMALVTGANVDKNAEAEK
jgi:hypothetical protein